jgi:hypothetical protein
MAADTKTGGTGTKAAAMRRIWRTPAVAGRLGAGLATGLGAAAALVAAPAAAHAQGWAPGFNVIPQPLGGQVEDSLVMARDGTAIGGELVSSGPSQRAGFTLTPQGGVTIWEGDPQTDSSRVKAISSGATHTAWMRGRRAADGTVVDFFPGFVASPFIIQNASISLDGQTVATSLQTVSSNAVPLNSEPYVWTSQRGLRSMGAPYAGATLNDIEDISGDGNVVVGYSRTFVFDDFIRPWTWTAAGGYTLLPTVPNARIGYAQPVATNGDGSVVVGSADMPGTQSRTDAVRWRDGAIQVLTPPPAALRSRASGVTDDGLTVIGTVSFTGGNIQPSVWREETGWVPLAEYLRGQGLEIPANYRLGSEFSISGDGRTIAGAFRDTTTNEVAVFIAVIPTPNTLGVLALVGVVCTRRARVRRGIV